MQPGGGSTTSQKDVFSTSLYLFKTFYSEVDTTNVSNLAPDVGQISSHIGIPEKLKVRLLGPLFLPPKVTINYNDSVSIKSAAQAILKSILQEQEIREELGTSEEATILEFIERRIKLDMLHLYLAKDQKEVVKKTHERIKWLQERDKKLAEVKEKDKNLDFSDGSDTGTASKTSSELQEIPGKSVFINVDQDRKILVGANSKGNLVCKCNNFDEATIHKTIEVLSGYTKITWRGVTNEEEQRAIEIACAKVGKRAICVGRVPSILMKTMEDLNDLVGWVNRIYKEYDLHQEHSKKSMQDLIQRVLGEDDEARERFINFWEELHNLPDVSLAEGPSAIGGDYSESQDKLSALEQAVYAAMSDRQKGWVDGLRKTHKSSVQAAVAANSATLDSNNPSQGARTILKSSGSGFRWMLSEAGARAAALVSTEKYFDKAKQGDEASKISEPFVNPQHVSEKDEKATQTADEPKQSGSEGTDSASQTITEPVSRETKSVEAKVDTVEASAQTLDVTPRSGAETQTDNQPLTPILTELIAQAEAAERKNVVLEEEVEAAKLKLERIAHEKELLERKLLQQQQTIESTAKIAQKEKQRNVFQKWMQQARAKKMARKFLEMEQGVTKGIDALEGVQQQKNALAVHVAKLEEKLQGESKEFERAQEMATQNIRKLEEQIKENAALQARLLVAERQQLTEDEKKGRIEIARESLEEQLRILQEMHKELTDKIAKSRQDVAVQTAEEKQESSKSSLQEETPRINAQQERKAKEDAAHMAQLKDTVVSTEQQERTPIEQKQAEELATLHQMHKQQLAQIQEQVKDRQEVGVLEEGQRSETIQEEAATWQAIQNEIQSQMAEDKKRHTITIEEANEFTNLVDKWLTELKEILTTNEGQERLQIYLDETNDLATIMRNKMQDVAAIGRQELITRHHQKLATLGNIEKLLHDKIVAIEKITQEEVETRWQGIIIEAKNSLKKMQDELTSIEKIKDNDEPHEERKKPSWITSLTRDITKKTPKIITPNQIQSELKKIEDKLVYLNHLLSILPNEGLTEESLKLKEEKLYWIIAKYKDIKEGYNKLNKILEDQSTKTLGSPTPLKSVLPPSRKQAVKEQPMQQAPSLQGSTSKANTDMLVYKKIFAEQQKSAPRKEIMHEPVVTQTPSRSQAQPSQPGLPINEPQPSPQLTSSVAKQPASTDTKDKLPKPKVLKGDDEIPSIQKPKLVGVVNPSSLPLNNHRLTSPIPDVQLSDKSLPGRQTVTTMLKSNVEPSSKPIRRLPAQTKLAADKPEETSIKPDLIPQPPVDDDDTDISALDIDIMLDELRSENITEAIARVKEYFENRDYQDPQALPHLCCLLLNYYASKKVPVNPAVDDLAKQVLVAHVIQKMQENTADMSETTTGMNLILDHEYYTLYSLLAHTEVGEQNINDFARSLQFIQKKTVQGKGLGTVIISLYQAYKEKERVIELPMLPQYNGGMKLTDPERLTFLKREELSLKEFLEVKTKLTGKHLKLTNEKEKLTYKLAYLIVSSNNELDSFTDKAEEFSRKIAQIELHTQKQGLKAACRIFFRVYQLLEYRRRCEEDLKKQKTTYFLGSKVDGITILEKLQQIKDCYFASEYPYTQKGVEIQEAQANDGKIILESPDDSTKKDSQKLYSFFKQQMQKYNKSTWKLSIILNIIKERGALPQGFLDKFADGGLCLLRDYIYPALRLKAPSNSGIPAKVDSLLGLLPSEASKAQQINFLQKSLQFMHDNLRGGFIRQTQIDTMLRPMRKVAVANRSGYVISKAGSGKTEMARYFAQCVLGDVPAILFISPVRETKADIMQLTQHNFNEFIVAQATDKPRKYFITPNEFHELLRNKLATLQGEELTRTLQALRKMLYVCDEFDSERYVRDGLSIQDMFLTHGITRVVNMSATDNLAALKIKLERRLFKLGTALLQELSLNESWSLTSEETIGTCIKEVTDITKRQKLEHIFARIIELEKSIAEIEKNIETELQEPKKKTIDTAYNGRITVASAVGKSVLLMYPDKYYSDVAKLVAQYSTEDNAILYRDPQGKRMAKYQDKTMSFETFRTQFNTTQVGKQPLVYCLYTVDSRGGDFDEFSNGNPLPENGDSRVMERYNTPQKLDSVLRYKLH